METIEKKLNKQGLTLNENGEIEQFEPPIKQVNSEKIDHLWKKGLTQLNANELHSLKARLDKMCKFLYREREAAQTEWSKNVYDLQYQYFKDRKSQTKKEISKRYSK